MIAEKFELQQNVNAQVVRNRQESDDLELKGRFQVEHWRDGELLGKYDFPNGITNVGKNLLLDVMFNGGTQVANNSWFVGLIDLTSYSALAASDIMSSHGGWVEFTSYTQSTRVAWGSGAASGQQVINASSAVFDINGSGTVKGIFVNTVSTKSGTTGTLWTTGLFNADVVVTSGDQIKITYGVAA